MAPDQPEWVSITPPTTPDENQLIAALRDRDVPPGTDPLATEAANEILRLNMTIRQCLQSIQRENVRAVTAEERISLLMGTNESSEVFDTDILQSNRRPRRRKMSLEDQQALWKKSLNND